MGEPLSRRQVAMLIWGSLLVGVLGMSFVAALVGEVTRLPGDDGARVAAILSAAGLAAAAASWVVPRVLRRSPEGTEALALARLVLSLGMAEAACLLAVVGYMLSGSAVTAAPFAAGLLAFAARFPTPGSWARLGGAGAGPNRMVR
jgi:hypothetical protein